ncbi:MAG: hypothetical protein M3Y54_00230 [Bacteroidota bacterium]|nr:hypothetical protein [Bacteroidota bacterium]
MKPSDEVSEEDGTTLKKQDQPIDAPSQNPPTNTPAGYNEELARQRDYQLAQRNHELDHPAGPDPAGPHPGPHRSVGAHGYAERSDQKDELQNLHIDGSETEPQGGNTTTANEQAQGPGFTEEGSFELGAGLRMHDQKFGEDHTSGPAIRPKDETSN